jgi:hypothetical protein
MGVRNMKKFILAFLFLLLIIPTAFAKSEKASDYSNKSCTTIQSGELLASDNSVITTGFDEFGYNYQGKMFSGRYCDSDRVIGGDYCDVHLDMKWNDAWLSNKDCSGDLKLDRYYGFDSYRDSGAWLTNHQSGEYEVDGEVCKWNYFVKIVAVPTDATEEGGIWFTTEGDEIGPVIWNSFAITQKVENDACADLHGLQYKSDLNGLGIFKP